MVVIKSNQIKPNLLFYLLYCAEGRNELTGPISESSRPGNTAPFKEMPQRWRAVMETLCPILSARGLNLRPPALETNAVPLDQLANTSYNIL